MYYLADFVTKERVEPKDFVFTGKDGPWEVIMDLNRVRSKFQHDYFRDAPPFVSKYLPFMPIENYAQFVSLKEGATPLLRSKRIGGECGLDLYFKLESQNPTGSFKDRGSAVEFTIARELGVKGVCVASTGNMAASCSCYAAAAQIPCFVFVPEETPASKLSQAISYGGRIVQVKGTYNDAAALAEEVARQLNFYLAGDYAFRVEGQKTAAFEVAEQLFYQTPDAVVVPMGCGTNIAGYAKGFREYKELGFIDRIPKIIGVQATGAQSIVNSYQKRSKSIEPLKKIETICSGIAVTNPLDGLKALDAIYSSDGEAVAVTDAEALEAQYLLSREEGLFVEASSATSLAAVMKLVKGGKFKGGRIVCVLTGDGLKDPSPMLRVAIKPPTIYPEVRDFLSLYENAFFEGRTISFVDRSKVIFSTQPKTEEVEAAIRTYLNGHYSAPQLSSIQEMVVRFLKKGKPVTFSDLQDIVQDVVETVQPVDGETLMVKDFEVTTAKDRKPLARVAVNLHGIVYEAQADGVGPVDAVINALQKACGDRMTFELAKYEVAIRSQGTDAVVCADITLKRNGRVSVGQGASPDVIQASIEAFEKAYNGL